MIGVDCHGFPPIVGRALGTEAVAGGAPKEAQMELSGNPKGAQKQREPLVGRSG